MDFNIIMMSMELFRKKTNNMKGRIYNYITQGKLIDLIKWLIVTICNYNGIGQELIWIDR